MKKIVILGNGSHSGVVVEALARSEYEVVEVIKIDPDLFPALPPGMLWHVAIGNNTIRENLIRHYLATLGASAGDCITTVIHPTAHVAKTATIWAGCFIGAGAVIGNRATLSHGVIVNTRAIVEHDCVIDPCVHLAPGVSMGGHVRIGSNAFVGVGACIRDRVTIGDHSIVGMGSVVTRSVPPGATVWGNPAKIKHETK